MANVNVADEPVDLARATRRPRVYYTAGPGNLIGAFRHWREGVDLPTEVSVTYSSQFFEVCQRLGCDAMAVASHPGYPKGEDYSDGPFRVRHRRAPWERWGGPLYHVGECIGDLGHIASAIRYRADVVLLHGGYGHWYLFSILRLFGIEVIPVLLVVLWLKHQPPRRVHRLLLPLNGWFFRRVASVILSMSEDCSRQVREITGGKPAPIEQILPKFRAALFDGLEPPPSPPPFRVFFAGRIERYKGVFDLLEVARRFAEEGRTDVEFDLAGNGPAIEELRRDVERSGLGGRFRVLGHCERTTMRRLYAASHVVIAPTRSDFAEGFNQVVAEAVIAGKPIITSSVCPALEMVRDAAVEVPPDDVKGYGDAILRLYEDPSLYDEKQRACPALREMFLGSDVTFDRVLERTLKAILERRHQLVPTD